MSRCFTWVTIGWL